MFSPSRALSILTAAKMTDIEGPGRLDIESILDFRLARLLIVLSAAQSSGIQVDTIDRIGYLDFFAANPFSVMTADKNEGKDRLALTLSGFSDRQLSYRSVGHRYVNRRKTLQNDLGVMFALGLLEITAGGYGLTERGLINAEALQSAYADSIRASAGIVARRIGRLSRKRLNEEAERALGKSWLVLDMFDDVKDVEIMETGEARG